jgi:hypothetical protein
MIGLSHAQRQYDRDISERSVAFQTESEYQAPEVAPLNAKVIKSHKYIELPPSVQGVDRR